MSGKTDIRIGLDLHVFDGLHQGSRVHCLEMFSRVVTLLPSCRFVCFLDDPALLEKSWPAFSSPNVTLVMMPHKSAPRRLFFQLPRLARKFQLSLLHTQYITPLRLPCPSAVTIHDILFEQYPQVFSFFFCQRSKILVRRSARTASLVFTVSEYSKRELATRYGLQEGRILVTPNGVNSDRFHPGLDAASLKAYGLFPGEYILTVGRLEPRKNHVRLFQAYARMPRPRPRLVVVGERDFGYAEILKALDTLELGEDVLLMEQVNDELLPLLYRNARLFIYVSLAEGFGMPVLEAMACGTAVVTSQTTALPEVAGDAAFYCDPSSVVSIGEAIQKALSSPEARLEKVALGKARVASFQWDRSAERLAAAYSKLLHLA